MIIYYLLYFQMLILVGLSCTRKVELFKYLFVCLFVFQLFVITVFRYNVGSDYMAYHQYFIETPELGLFFSKSKPNVEIGYLFLNSVVKTFGGGFEVLIAIISLFILITLKKLFDFFAISSKCLSLSLYIALFYFSLNFNLIRHGIVLVLIWLAFIEIYKGKTLRSILIILFAALFHLTALFFLWTPFLIHKEKSRKFYITMIVCAIGLYFFSFTTNILGSVVELYFGGDSKISYYFFDYYSGDDSNQKYGLTMGLVMNAIILILFLFKKNKTGPEVILQNSLFVAIFLIFSLNDLAILVERFSNILIFSIIFIFPILAERFKKKQITFIIYLSFFCFYSSLYFFKEIYKKDAYDDYRYIPYKTVFAK